MTYEREGHRERGPPAGFQIRSRKEFLLSSSLVSTGARNRILMKAGAPCVTSSCRALGHIKAKQATSISPSPAANAVEFKGT